LPEQPKARLAFPSSCGLAITTRRFPSTVEVADGGSKTRLETWEHFITMTNELVTPKILHCPEVTLRSKSPATFPVQRPGLRALTNTAVSYAVGTGAVPDRPAAHLAGDRNLLGRDGQGCGPAAIFGFITQLRLTDNPLWTNTMHVNAGNMVLADGSAHQSLRLVLPSRWRALMAIRTVR